MKNEESNKIVDIQKLLKNLEGDGEFVKKSLEFFQKLGSYSVREISRKYAGSGKMDAMLEEVRDGIPLHFLEVNIHEAARIIDFFNEITLTNNSHLRVYADTGNPVVMSTSTLSFNKIKIFKDILSKYAEPKELPEADFGVLHLTIWPNRLCLMNNGKTQKEIGFGALKAGILTVIARAKSSAGTEKIATSLNINKGTVGREISDIRRQVFEKFGIPTDTFLPKILPRKGYRFGKKVQVTIGKK